MSVLPGFPPVEFDYGAINTLAGALAARGVARPLIITDVGLAEHGIVDKVCAALPAGLEVAVHSISPPVGKQKQKNGDFVLIRPKDRHRQHRTRRQ